MLDKINRLLQKDAWPLVFKIISLFALLGLIVLGLLASSNDADFLVQLRNFNLGNLLVWCYWWPLIVFSAIFLGRQWCLICPVELITSFFAKIGLKKKRPKWLLSGWAITLFYLLILFVGIQVFKVHRNPTSMAFYLLAIVSVSIVVGLIYEKNTFCRYVCPVGYLLGLYSRLSPLGWRVADPDICRNCKDKSCVRTKHRYDLINKSCGVDLYPGKLDQNDYCILCAGCLKTCDKYQPSGANGRPNPGLRYIGFAKDLLSVKPLKNAEAFFVLLVSGFVISEILSEWRVTDGLLNYVPNLILSNLPWENTAVAGLVYAMVIFFELPFVLWLIPFLLSWLSGLKISFSSFTKYYSLAFLPIIAAAHLSKGVLKISSRLPYFQHVFSDVSGMNTTRLFLEQKITLAANPAWVNFVVSMSITLFIAGGIVLSFAIIHQVNRKLFGEGVRRKLYYLIPVAYGSIFFFTILLWRWIY
ncbi:hypothetical protein A2V82_04025 [candidate division KSB1 bacterium RBG_16_48_16]|nr:MAG: hypothetical protein A2V82_04025 [candidate division KSB1 bacterium RBG_16_48_16]